MVTISNTVKVLKGSYGNVTILDNKIIKESKHKLCSSALREIHFMTLIGRKPISVDIDPLIKIIDCNYGKPLSEISVDTSYEDKLSILFSLICQIANFHQMGICHNDLTFNNILVKDNKVNIIDWGQACYQSTNAQYSIYDKWFRDPQYKNNDKISISDDIWALGCIIIWVLTNKNPERKYYDQSNIKELGLPNKSFEKLIMNIMTNSNNRISAHNIIRNYYHLWSNMQIYDQTVFKIPNKVSTILDVNLDANLDANLDVNLDTNLLKWCINDMQSQIIYTNTKMLYNYLTTKNKSKHNCLSNNLYILLVCYYLSYSVLGVYKIKFIDYKKYIEDALIDTNNMTQSKFIRLASMIIKSLNCNYVLLELE
jgi:serine/threonine protein kinase